MPVKASLDHLLQGGGSIPITLIIGVENFAMTIHPQTSRRSHSHGPRNKLTLRRHFEGPASVACCSPHFTIMNTTDVPL